MLKIIKIKNKKTKKIEERLKNNGGYCPCALQKTPDTKCMCKDFREQTEPGTCHCGLYQKVEENIKNVTTLERVEKLIKDVKLVQYTVNTEMPITFEFLVGSLFPSAFNNIKEEMKNQYTLGYMAGLKDSKNKNKI